MSERIPPELHAVRRDVARLEERRDAFLREAARLGVVNHERLAEIDRSIAGVLDAILGVVDPCDASPVDPLVLLPVRLETRFGTARGRTTLRVRIYPDEIHVDDLARGLTPEETDAGRAFWTSVWSESPSETAWPTLITGVGSPPAASSTTPTSRRP